VNSFGTLSTLTKQLQVLILNSSKRQFVQYRPSESILANPKSWWKYTLDCISHRTRLQKGVLTKERLDERRENRRAYCQLYKQQLALESTGPSEDNKKKLSQVASQLNELEEKMSVNDIAW
jgi:hypothetical protein